MNCEGQTMDEPMFSFIEKSKTNLPIMEDGAFDDLLVERNLEMIQMREWQWSYQTPNLKTAEEETTSHWSVAFLPSCSEIWVLTALI